jgi:hypothetical protein
VITGPSVSTDPNYAGLDAADVDVTNLDDDPAYPASWQNPSHPCDVNDDLMITAADVLGLINEINLHSARPLPMPPGPPHVPPPFLDPTGDCELSAADVLYVINYINAHGTVILAGGMSIPAGHGEGERVTTPLDPRAWPRLEPAVAPSTFDEVTRYQVGLRNSRRLEAEGRKQGKPCGVSMPCGRGIVTIDLFDLEETISDMVDAVDIDR